MIAALQLIRNLGKFDALTGASLPFKPLTLVYAENGRGKTTIAAIVRSLATGAALPIEERHRLASSQSPHVVLKTSDAPSPIIYQNGRWSRTLPNISVFDDAFINENVYSGLTVEAAHRQHLHELILGSSGVALNNELRALAVAIETHNSTLRAKAAALPPSVRGPFTAEQFCHLPARATIDVELLEAERSFAAAKEHDPVIQTPDLARLLIPAFNIADIEGTLSCGITDLESDAAARVRDHLAQFPDSAENWVSRGISLLRTNGEDRECPFCAQDLATSPVFAHYTAYFGEAYGELQASVRDALSTMAEQHGESARVAFERSVHDLNQRLAFWSRFVDVPAFELETEALTAAWQGVRESLEADLRLKQTALLDVHALSSRTREAVAAFDTQLQRLAQFQQLIETTNRAIRLQKERTAFSNTTALAATVDELRANRNRHLPEWVSPCRDFLEEKTAKEATEALREAARHALDHYRTNVIPGYQIAINLYLARFATGFRIDAMAALNVRGGSSCRYSVVINNTPVPVAGGDPEAGVPSFRNTLSAGDRNALALAFFFASLDHSGDLASKIVVIDDPMSSLDAHRTLTTAQEARKLADRAEQVIVLSHSKAFLSQVWVGADKSASTAFQLVRDGESSGILAWDVDAYNVTDHDQRYALLALYLDVGTGDVKEVAHSIRPHLEAYLRVAVPGQFKSGQLLGPFRNICEQRAGTPNQILSAPDTEVLGDLIEYANRFHHDTNPAWQSITINDAELMTFVRRTLEFAGP